MNRKVLEILRWRDEDATGPLARSSFEIARR
jgi:hypothetical protein